MRVLSFDPGSTKSGWAELDVADAFGPIVLRYVAAGEVPSTRDAVRDLIVNSEAEIVAVEKLAGIAYQTKGAGIVSALIASSNVAGMIAALAYAEGRQVVEMPAVEWRRMVCGKPNASDKIIKDVIPRLVRMWPRRSNCHERDAAGLAIAVAWREVGSVRKAAGGR